LIVCLLNIVDRLILWRWTKTVFGMILTNSVAK
jgi:hypothetical protein